LKEAINKAFSDMPYPNDCTAGDYIGHFESEHSIWGKLIVSASATVMFRNQGQDDRYRLNLLPVDPPAVAYQAGTNRHFSHLHGGEVVVTLNQTISEVNSRREDGSQGRLNYNKNNILIDHSGKSHEGSFLNVVYYEPETWHGNTSRINFAPQSPGLRLEGTFASDGSYSGSFEHKYEHASGVPGSGIRTYKWVLVPLRQNPMLPPSQTTQGSHLR
jgi:hypothetical protein